MFIGNKGDFLTNYSKDIEQGTELFDYLQNIISVYVGNRFMDFLGGIPYVSNTLDSFGGMHTSGIHNVSFDTKENPLAGQPYNTGFAFFLKRNIVTSDELNTTIRGSYNELQLFVTVGAQVWLRVVNGNPDGTLTSGRWVKLYGVNNTILKLDTPYYTTKMKAEGVHQDFIDYMDAKHEYDRGQDVVDGASNLMILEEPVPSERLKAFADKYLG